MDKFFSEMNALNFDILQNVFSELCEKPNVEINLLKLLGLSTKQKEKLIHFFKGINETAKKLDRSI